VVRPEEKGAAIPCTESIAASALKAKLWRRNLRRLPSETRAESLLALMAIRLNPTRALAKPVSHQNPIRYRPKNAPRLFSLIAERRDVARIFTLREEIEVQAPVERCFLLSTSVELVQQELGMRPVRGRTTGLVLAGDTIRWQGRQLGLPMFHESLIDSFDPPAFFRDRMIAGRFASFEHDHTFVNGENGIVTMLDELRFTMPFGTLGALIGELVLVPHIRGLMKRRFVLLKRIAESEEWRTCLPQRN
jgi:ligand-binding SRPBCC domain-containing protein